ncbi:MAG: type VI secretion system ATPase TssH [Ectothiorhodospiraceae bacterium]|nr:type VI secretion system ATPase TssH [Ectothiorhodospiraceae bacterium]MCH8504494.1 type VI secretion system ATPase TssH [Ectothiorhodospiraceae bacterium]
MEFDQLIKKMSPACRNLFESAVAGASSRTHYAVDLEHLLQQLASPSDQGLAQLLRHSGLEAGALADDIQRTLDAMKTGNGGFPKIAPDIARLLFESWMVASTQCGSLEIRPEHLLLAIAETESLRLRAQAASGQFQRLDAESIRTLIAAGAAEPVGGVNERNGGRALEQFTIDLTAAARAGRLDPVLGRENEVRQMIDILCRRRQNNPILTGEAGVGKTAVVEGLAQRIADGDVPLPLQDVALRTLDLGLLQAGAGVKGEFENRLKNVISEVQSSARPVILFIDEAHTLIGAGNQAGSGDAANLLKPALARGELRTIAATTWAEYKKYFETDAALTRRFQVIKVEEPSEEQATVMLRGFAAALEKHHRVAILDEAVTAAVRLSKRYIPGRQLPDKSVSLLDTACARVRLSLDTVPARLEADQQALRHIGTERERLCREQDLGIDHGPALEELAAREAALTASQESLQERWQAARQLAERIFALTVELAETRGSEKHGPRQALADTRKELRALQGKEALIFDCVDADVVAQVVADWTGIPVGRMQADDIDQALTLEQSLSQRVVGQPHALTMIARTMRIARTRLGDPRRPLAVFMLVGPSGIGKTETALALAEQLYGSDEAITTINMSEFKEEHKVSLLMGSPPGYVGYGEGGVLTEAVRRKPYSVVLLDEMEKAHPGVQDIFYQVFDKGVLKDGEGRNIDFRNTVIIMTSNTASDEISGLATDPETRPEPEALIDAISPALKKSYKPAFLGRVQLIPYYPLEKETLARIAELQLNAIRQRIASHYGATVHFGKALLDHITERCIESDTGARQVAAMLNNGLLPQLSSRLLEHLARDLPVAAIHTDMDATGFRISIDSGTGAGSRKKRSRKKPASVGISA